MRLIYLRVLSRCEDSPLVFDAILGFSEVKKARLDASSVVETSK